MTTTQLELAAFVTGLALLVFLLTIGVDWVFRWAGRKDPVVSAPLISADRGVTPQECANNVHDMQAIPLGDGRWLHECVGCHLKWWIDETDYDYGCPMVIDEDPAPEVAYYGTRLVHRLCIEGRRDGGAVCSTCATVMDGVRAA